MREEDLVVGEKVVHNHGRMKAVQVLPLQGVATQAVTIVTRTKQTADYNFHPYLSLSSLRLMSLNTPCNDQLTS